MDKLMKIAGFDSLSRRGMNMLMYSFKTRKYTIRDTIYTEGDDNDKNFYIIKTGQFRVIKHLSVYENYNQNIGDQLSVEMMKLIYLNQRKQS